MRFYAEKLKYFWKNTNLATRSLLLLGFLSLIQIICTIFLGYGESTAADVTIRSIASSIFGFVFGDQSIDNSNIASKEIQIIIASIVALITLLVVIFSLWLNVEQSSGPLSEIRNLLFGAVGFLISRAKSNNV